MPTASATLAKALFRIFPALASIRLVKLDSRQTLVAKTDTRTVKARVT